MEFIIDPSRWLQGFVVGMTTTVFFMIFTSAVATFIWNLAENRRMARGTKKRQEIENGERCIGGIKGCKGGKTCTSDHK